MTAKPQSASTPQLHLVPARQPSHSPLTLWHLLSLDAPTVACVWTIFIARTVHLRLPWTAPIAMFLAVWMLYAADRLLDARIGPRDELEPRHHFHHTHRAAFLAGILVCAFFLLWLIPKLFPSALYLFALLAVLLVTYFFLIHVAVPGAKRLPKELAVGLFFPAAIFVPTVARVPALRLLLLPEALLFAAVCTLNCLYVYAWEHRPPFVKAHWTTRFAVSRLLVLTIATAVASAMFSLTRHSSIPIATCASALVLLTLDLSHKRLSATHLRAAADLALLTPVLLPAFWR